MEKRSSSGRCASNAHGLRYLRLFAVLLATILTTFLAVGCTKPAAPAANGDPPSPSSASQIKWKGETTGYAATTATSDKKKGDPTP
jgi:hypothetical protein